MGDREIIRGRGDFNSAFSRSRAFETNHRGVRAYPNRSHFDVETSVAGARNRSFHVAADVDLTWPHSGSFVLAARFFGDHHHSRLNQSLLHALGGDVGLPAGNFSDFCDRFDCSLLVSPAKAG